MIVRLATAGHVCDFDRDQFAAGVGGAKAHGDANLILADFVFNAPFARAEIALKASVREDRLAVVGRAIVVEPATDRVACQLPAQRRDLPVEPAHAGFPSVVAHDLWPGAVEEIQGVSAQGRAL